MKDESALNTQPGYFGIRVFGVLRVYAVECGICPEAFIEHPSVGLRSDIVARRYFERYGWSIRNNRVRCPLHAWTLPNVGHGTGPLLDAAVDHFVFGQGIYWPKGTGLPARVGCPRSHDAIPPYSTDTDVALAALHVFSARFGPARLMPTIGVPLKYGCAIESDDEKREVCRSAKTAAEAICRAMIDAAVWASEVANGRNAVGEDRDTVSEVHDSDQDAEGGGASEGAATGPGVQPVGTMPVRSDQEDSGDARSVGLPSAALTDGTIMLGETVYYQGEPVEVQRFRAGRTLKLEVVEILHADGRRENVERSDVYTAAEHQQFSQWR